MNCSHITMERIWSHVDVFAYGHFLGWMFKAILIRHVGILWAISIMWEITEITFAHLLPNFIECWWDALILDVLVCNGLGIWCGLKICQILEMREYKWASIRDISSTTGKIKRAVLQFTPVSWSTVRWLNPESTYMRFISVSQLVVFWQVTELNTFFLKHIFEMPPSHPVVAIRLIFIGLIVAPSVRQYYIYVTDPRCKRLGTQCWVYCAIMVSEAILCIKNARDLFERTQAVNIIAWLIIQMIISVIFVYGCILFHRYRQVIEYKSDCIVRKKTLMIFLHRKHCRPRWRVDQEPLSEQPNQNPQVKLKLTFIVFPRLSNIEPKELLTGAVCQLTRLLLTV